MKAPLRGRFWPRNSTTSASTSRTARSALQLPSRRNYFAKEACGRFFVVKEEVLEEFEGINSTNPNCVVIGKCFESISLQMSLFEMWINFSKLIDWLIGWLVDRWMVADQSIDWLIDWLIGSLVDWLIDWLIGISALLISPRTVTISVKFWIQCLYRLKIFPLLCGLKSYVESFYFAGDAQENFSYENVNRAFSVLINSPKPTLLSMGCGRFYKESDGLKIDVGVYCKGLEYACGIKAEYVGKPDPAYFLSAGRGTQSPTGVLHDDR